MKSIHPTFQQVTRQGTLFGEAVKGGPKPGGKKPKAKKPMKKKAQEATISIGGRELGRVRMDRGYGGGHSYQKGDAAKQVRRFGRGVKGEWESLSDKERLALKAGAGGLLALGPGRAVIKALMKKKAEAAGEKLQEAVLKGATKQREVTGQAGDTVDPNDSAARYGSGTGREIVEGQTVYGGGLGNFEGKRAPKFNEKFNPTDMPKAFGKKASTDVFLGGFLDEFMKVAVSRKWVADKVRRGVHSAHAPGGGGAERVEKFRKNMKGLQRKGSNVKVDPVSPESAMAGAMAGIATGAFPGATLASLGAPGAGAAMGLGGAIAASPYARNLGQRLHRGYRDLKHSTKTDAALRSARKATREVKKNPYRKSPASAPRDTPYR